MVECVFDKSRRLLDSSEFKSVFDGAVLKVSNQQLLFLAIPNQYTKARLGLVIAKKNVRLAVNRNRVKRIIRESFRCNESIPAIDTVVLARRGIDQLDNAALHQMLDQLWQKLTDRANRRPLNSN